MTTSALALAEHHPTTTKVEDLHELVQLLGPQKSRWYWYSLIITFNNKLPLLRGTLPVPVNIYNWPVPIKI